LQDSSQYQQSCYLETNTYIHHSLYAGSCLAVLQISGVTLKIKIHHSELSMDWGNKIVQQIN